MPSPRESPGVQIAAMGGLELFTPQRLNIGPMVVIPILLFTHLGIRLARHIDAKTFDLILLTLFVVMEINMVIDVILAVSS